MPLVTVMRTISLIAGRTVVPSFTSPAIMRTVYVPAGMAALMYLESSLTGVSPLVIAVPSSHVNVKLIAVSSGPLAILGICTAISALPSPNTDSYSNEETGTPSFVRRLNCSSLPVVALLSISQFCCMTIYQYLETETEVKPLCPSERLP